MTNYLYSEEFQDLSKSQKKHDLKPCFTSPSNLTMKFILGYGAALSVIKTSTIGHMKILLN
jgi:hypothetical protein